MFPVAVPLRLRDVGRLFEIEPSQSERTETAQVSSYTRVAREIIDVQYLEKIVKKRCPAVDIFSE